MPNILKTEMIRTGFVDTNYYLFLIYKYGVHFENLKFRSIEI